MFMNCSVFCDVQNVRSSILGQNVIFGKLNVQTFNVRSVRSSVFWCSLQDQQLVSCAICHCCNPFFYCLLLEIGMQSLLLLGDYYSALSAGLYSNSNIMDHCWPHSEDVIQISRKKWINPRPKAKDFYPIFSKKFVLCPKNEASNAIVMQKDHGLHRNFMKKISISLKKFNFTKFSLPPWKGNGFFVKLHKFHEIFITSMDA